MLFIKYRMFRLTPTFNETEIICFVIVYVLGVATIPLLRGALKVLRAAGIVVLITLLLVGIYQTISLLS